MLRIFTKKVIQRSTSLVFYSKNYSKEVNVVKSKLPDVQIPSILLNEYIWKDVDKWKDKTALVRILIVWLIKWGTHLCIFIAIVFLEI